MQITLRALLVAGALAELGAAQFTSMHSVGDWTPNPRPSQPAAGTNLYGYDDGSWEMALGLTNGGEIVWMHRFDTNDFGVSSDTLNAIGTAWGAQQSGETDDLFSRLYVWDDLDDDGDPTTGLLLLVNETPTFIRDSGTDAIGFTNLTSPATVNNIFFVGVSVDQEVGDFLAPLDASQPSLERAWVTGNDNAGGFDPTDLGGPGSVGVFELDELGYPGVWALRTGDVGANTHVYCTAKVSSCTSEPTIGSSGAPSAASSAGFSVFAFPALREKPGLLLYTDSGPANPPLPFQGGLLCINPAPLARSVPIVAGGGGGGFPNPCLGVLSIDMNAFAAGALGGNPLAFLTIPGTQIDCQFWGRDNLVVGSLLSNALDYTVQP